MTQAEAVPHWCGFYLYIGDIVRIPAAFYTTGILTNADLCGKVAIER